MALVPTNTKQRSPNIKFNSVLGWPKGVDTRRSVHRSESDFIRNGENVELSQDGAIKPRRGLKLYSIQPTNPVIGQVYEYVKVVSTVAETWLVWAENDSGTGKIYTAKDGTSNTLVTGNTYDSSADIHFEQVANSVLITNGVDNLSYMDIDSQTITVFTALTTPSITSVVGTGLTGTALTYRYRITATNQGETDGSIASTVDVVKDRTLWDGTTEYTTLTWPSVTNADRYNIYIGDQAGFEYYLDTVVDPGTGGNVTYVDTGAIFSNSNRLVPVGNSTAGPLVTRATNIRGQPFMVGDKTPTQEGRIWFGGTTSESALDFTAFNGGGWVEPNKGGKDFPVIVVPFRDGLGNPGAVALSKSTNGSGKRYLLKPSTATLGTTVISFMGVQEDNGQAGTDSPDGVVVVDDALFYPSRADFKTSATKPQVQNIISTTGITNNISTTVNSLISSDMDSAVGLVDDRRIYWAIPYLSTTNNQIWTLDLRQKGAWMLPLQISADWMTLYAENSTGKTQFLVLQNDKFYVFDEALLTEDDGVAFQTSIGSGAIKFSKDGAIWASVIDVTFVFLNPIGSINVNVLSHTEDGPINLTDVVNSATSLSVSGYGAYGWGDVGWGNVENQLPLTVKETESRVPVTIDVDEESDWITWGVSTVDAGVSYELSEVIVRYVPIGFINTN